VIAMLPYMVKIKSKDDEKTILTCDPKYGDGEIISYTPVEGIGVFYSDYLMKAPYGYCGEYDRTNILEFNYCVSGKYETEYSDQTVNYLTDGDFSVWSGKGEVVASDSSFKRYKGITIYIDVVKAEASIRQMIRDEHIDLRTCINETLSGKTIIIFKPGVKVLHIFNELYDLPLKYILDYLRIKVAELLLLVYTGDFKYDESEARRYPRMLVQSVKGAKAYIENYFFEHITIADLAQRSCVNSRKLMECFKYIYGMTINECIQKTRMTKAGELLLTTDFKVGDISALVGYENASKFAEMFRRHYEISPARYRKEHEMKK
jgi:AraC-like DNA-binding protein